MPPPEHPWCTERASILVVQEQPRVRGFVASALRQAGFVTLEAANAVQALDLLRANCDSVVLVIIDMVTPEMRGLEFAGEVEHAHSGVRVLFIARQVSGIAMEGVRLRYPDLILAKPFSQAELLSHVTALL